MIKISVKLFALLIAVSLFGPGCQTFTSSRFKSEVQVFKLAEAQTYEAQFKITEGHGEDATVLSSPKIVFRAGEPAKMRIGDADSTIYAEAYVSPDGADPVCLCKTRIRRNGKYVFHHSEIVTPKAR
jgi:hypothetical protein